MAISIAAPSDYDGIRAIWEERFTADEKYLRVMFSKIIPLCTSYVYKNADGEIVSVASFMPMKHIDSAKNATLRGWYMFGVATLEKATGKRLAANTISYATEDISRSGYHFIFERPANQSLNNYYLKLGFSKALKRLPMAFSTLPKECSTENKPGNSHPITAPEYILEQINRKYNKKFLWENNGVLEGLIELGELDEHINSEGFNTAESTYIAINPLNDTPSDTFNHTFFCFPME